MNFFKKNSYDIVRLYINQIGIMIFSFLLYFSVGDLDDRITTAVSAFAMLFYLCLIYTVVWEIGSKDKIRIDGGKMEPDRLKGMKMALFANVPNFVLAAFSILFVLIFIGNGSEAIKTVFSVFYLILRFHGAMFMGVIIGMTPTITDVTLSAYFIDCLVESILYFALPLISVAVSQLAYYLGTKDKKIFSFLSAKKNK